jgi:hypothetical protein
MGYIQKLGYFMKTVLRKLFFNQRNRWIPILLFTAGFGMQIAGKWLPTLVICYKVNEKPKIEFFDNACDCRKVCACHTLAGLHESSARLQSSCLDVPLIMDPVCGPLPRFLFLHGGPCGPTYELFAALLPPFLFSQKLETACPRLWLERADNGSLLVLYPGGTDSILCRFIC